MQKVKIISHYCFIQFWNINIYRESLKLIHFAIKTQRKSAKSCMSSNMEVTTGIYPAFWLRFNITERMCHIPRIGKLSDLENKFIPMLEWPNTKYNRNRKFHLWMEEKGNFCIFFWSRIKNMRPNKPTGKNQLKSE